MGGNMIVAPTEMPPWEYFTMVSQAAKASGISVEEAVKFVSEMALRMQERQEQPSSMVNEPDQVM
jgi:hypothetical protein